MDFNKKGNKAFFNDKLLFRVLGVAFLIIIFVLILADFKMYQKKRELAAQVNSYQKKIEDIKKSSQTLKDEIANSDNPDYLEKIAYEQLGQTKAGETEYIFITPPKQTEAAAKPQNFWDNFMGSLSSAWSWIKSKI